MELNLTSQPDQRKSDPQSGNGEPHQLPKEKENSAFAPEKVAEWFVAITGLIYSTGFLVVLTFSDYMGAREAASDFFRAKFLHVGILCLSLPVLFVGALYGIALLRLPGGMPIGKRLYTASIVLVFNLLLAFYTFLMFAPVGYVGNKPLVAAIFLSTLIGIILIQTVEKIIKQEFIIPYRRYARWILCVAVVVWLDWYCFHEISPRLFEILWPNGIIFLGFVASIATTVLIVRLRVRDYPERSGKLAVCILAACIIGPLYFLMVFSFAYFIYPNIPASRGGGDFVQSPYIVLRFEESAIKQVPVEINNQGVSQPLVLIEETANWLVVADPDDAGGPKAWRKGVGRPQIYSINRGHVVSIVYESRKKPPVSP